MFRHQIAHNASLVDFSDYPSEIIPPVVPQNLVVESDTINREAFVTWEPPTTGGKVFYYELFLNGSHLANVSDRKYVYSNASGGDTFKVRAVGVLGLLSGFSNTDSYEGTIGLIPTATGLSNPPSLHIQWNDISNTDQVNVEGYHVYKGGTKQNSSLLPLEVLEYPLFNLSTEVEYNIGVSFEYDGGQESAVFDLDVTAPSGDIAFIAIQTSFHHPLVLASTSIIPGSLSDDSLGLHVEDGTRVTFSPSFDPGDQHDEAEWSSPASFRYTYNARPLGEEVMEFLEGCGKGLSLLPGEGNMERSKIFNLGPDGYARSVSLSLLKSYTFRFSGPQCNDPKSLYLSASLQLNEGDIIGRATGQSRGRTFIEAPSEEDGLLNADDSGSNAVVFTWTTFPGTPIYNLYIKSAGASSYPTDPYNSEYLTIKNQLLTVDSLAGGNYDARMDFMLQDGTVMRQSDEISFTIS